ncbi:cell division protein FtsL [Ferrithrix thermotolerans DSM 19514]|jgi:cell division protein FtsL|uniref:Cell division protein FtsL n=1 Tax=Ferrithrix thermotolerans DSM 19514 TaxID=1121881 RepID=A0A1M4TRT6_9ACTN|nr:hypothetical protein [Ferrithrix thermotolerans]SHE47219.1 cell division protein FtsL [Ferrithrix thermotolerans DSM 19514]
MAKSQFDVNQSSKGYATDRLQPRSPAYTPPKLKVLERHRRIDQIRSRITPFLLGSVVLAALFVAVLARAEMAAMQLRLQSVQSQIAKASDQQQSLLLKVGQLSSPSRVIAYAEHRLNLVPPTQSSVVGGSSISGGQSVTKIPLAQSQVPLPAGYQVAPSSSRSTKVG